MKIARMDLVMSEVPGKLCVGVWSAGCSFDCTGCHNPELQDFNHPGAKDWSPARLSDRLYDMCSFLISGVCWMGGEPTQQSDFMETLELVHAKMPEKIQVLYTGLKFSELGPHLTGRLDMVVDGRWLGVPVWESGSNQEVHVKFRCGWEKIPWDDVGKWDKGD